MDVELVKPSKKRIRSASSSNDKEEAMTKDLTQYVTTKQAAEMLGVVTEHINHLLLAGRLKGTKFGKSWMVYLPSIEQYVEKKSPGGRPPSRGPQLQISE